MTSARHARALRGLAVLVALSTAACAELRGAPARSTRLRPTCELLERDTCTTETVSLTLADLRLPEWSYAMLDRRPVPVQCVLRETGAVEACRVLDSRSPQADEAVVDALERRTYAPPTYEGRPVLVPYTFLATFAPLPAEVDAERGVRAAAFRALLKRLGPAPAAAESTSVRRLVCAGIGPDLSDPARSELDSLARAGTPVEPASACLALLDRLGDAARFDAIVVREITPESSDTASVRAEVTRAGGAPETVEYRARRRGGGWRVDEVPTSAPPPPPTTEGPVAGAASAAPDAGVPSTPEARAPALPADGGTPGRRPGPPAPPRSGPASPPGRAP